MNDYDERIRPDYGKAIGRALGHFPARAGRILKAGFALLANGQETATFPAGCV
jgi:hypothetical protein